MAKTAIVLGATGLIGRSLVDQLVCSQGYGRVLTLTRRPCAHQSDIVENRVIDFEQLAQYGEALQGDVLFSCLGTTRAKAGSIAAQRRIDVDYQLNAAVLAANNGVAHYLLVSSAGADANSGRAYLRMKGELEQRVRALPFKRISILQPSLLLGQRNEVRVAEQLGSYPMRLVCLLPGLRRYRPIQGQQVAKKLLSLASRPLEKRGNSESAPQVEVLRLAQLFED